MKVDGRKILIHVDLDAFFASVEMIALDLDPEVPLVIGSDPQEGRGRGIVSTCNYAARRYGIRSAMPISEAWRRCPSEPLGNAMYQGPRFALYRRASKRVMEILCKKVDRFEQVSIDEAILDVTQVCKYDSDQAFALARNRQRAIFNQTGLTCSIGIGPTRILAKVASEMEKPRGIVHIDPSQIPASIDHLEIRKIPGIGPKSATHLAESNLLLIGDLREAGPEALVEILGYRRGNRLWRAIEGDTSSQVDPIRSRKSLGKETTFARDVLDQSVVEAALNRVSAHAIERLQSLNAEAKTIEVKLRYKGFETLTHARTLIDAQAEYEPIRLISLRLLADMLDAEKPVRLVGIRLSGLIARPGYQTLLEVDQTGDFS